MALSKRKVIGELGLKSSIECKIEWVIKDILSYTEKDTEYTSSDFTVSGSKWCLTVFPNGGTITNSVGWISLFLSPSKDQNLPVSANYILDVKKADGTLKKFNFGVRISHVFNGHESFGYTKFLKRSELLKEKSELMPSNILTVVCVLEELEDNFNSIYNWKKLSEKFEDSFISQKLCDVTLKVQDQEFSAHRLILSAHSPVFAAMFEVEMQEKATGVVDISGCDPRAFGDFLFYLYSGKCKDFPNNVFELYRITHLYDVEELKSNCLTYIANNLSLENLYDAVILGDEYDEQEIIVRTQDFFKKNFTEIVYTEKWKSFLKSNCDLANQMLKGMAGELKSKKN